MAISSTMSIKLQTVVTYGGCHLPIVLSLISDCSVIMIMVVGTIDID